MLLHTTLYKLHSTGKVGDWTVAVGLREDGTVVLTRTSTKVMGGKPISNIVEFTEGKNIGKSNETTPAEQAINTAKSLIASQLDKGYVTEIPSADDAVTNALGYPMPMLALTVDEVAVDYGSGVYIQPKLDGHKVLSTYSDGRIILYSRKGKLVNLPHVREALAYAKEKGVWNGEVLDGEIYLHGMSLQTISSLVKKLQPGTYDLVYHIYDVVMDKPYEDRLEFISLLINVMNAKSVTLTETTRVTSESDAIELHHKYVRDGYEGSMVRHTQRGYEGGKRSQTLLKRKDFIDAEFEIINYKFGKPVIGNTRTYQIPIFICVTAEGVVFDCTAPGTIPEKHAFYEDGLEKYIGRFLTVKYFKYTPYGTPYLPVALRVREDI